MKSVIIAHISHINPAAAAAILYGKTVTITVYLNRPLIKWGNNLVLLFNEGNLVKNNLRENEDIPDEGDFAAEYFISPLHNLEDANITCVIE